MAAQIDNSPAPVDIDVIRRFVGSTREMSATELGRDPDRQRTLRFLCALAPTDVADQQLPAWVLDVVGNTGLTIDDTRFVLDSDGQEPSGPVLRRAASRTRAKVTDDELARQAGLSADTAVMLTNYLGAVDAAAAVS